MQFQLLIAALVGLSSVSSALPAVSEVSGLDVRADEIATIEGLPSKTIKCGEKSKYTKKEVEFAIKKGGQVQNEGKQVGPDRDNKYPFKFKDPENLPGMPRKYEDAVNMQHFPMKNGKSAYNGARKPKPERVMYIHDKGSDKATFVGLWTHEGSETGQYKQCKEE